MILTSKQLDALVEDIRSDIELAGEAYLYRGRRLNPMSLKKIYSYQNGVQVLVAYQLEVGASSPVVLLEADVLLIRDI